MQFAILYLEASRLQTPMFVGEHDQIGVLLVCGEFLLAVTERHLTHAQRT